MLWLLVFPLERIPLFSRKDRTLQWWWQHFRYSFKTGSYATIIVWIQALVTVTGRVVVECSLNIHVIVHVKVWFFCVKNLENTRSSNIYMFRARLYVVLLNCVTGNSVISWNISFGSCVCVTWELTPLSSKCFFIITMSVHYFAADTVLYALLWLSLNYQHTPIM